MNHPALCASVLACAAAGCVVGDDPRPLSQLFGTEGLVDYTIAADQSFYIDRSYTIGNLTVHGKLYCQPDVAAPITVTATSITVSGPGALLECGTEAQRYDGAIRFLLRDTGAVADGHVHGGGAPASIAVEAGGTLRMFGNRAANFGWQRIAAEVRAGATAVALEQPVGWQVGDRLALGPTGFDFAEAEERTVAAVSADGRTVTVTEPFAHDHGAFTKEYVEGARRAVLDQRAEIANLTRNIVISSAGDRATLDQTRRGAGVVIRAGGAAYVDGVEFSLGGKLGVLGEYPFHWHLVGDASGQFLRNSAIHHSYQRCVTIHGTNAAEVSDNVCFDHLGHGYFFEQGNEVKNVMRHNLGMLSRRVELGAGLLDSDMRSDQTVRFSAPSTFWITNPDNDVRDNVASGSQGTGFWMSFSQGIRCGAGGDPYRCDGRVDPPEANNLVPARVDTLRFDGNIAHSAVVGITWDGAEDGPRSTVTHDNPTARTTVSSHYHHGARTPVFDSLQAWKNVACGIYFRGAAATFANLLAADNGRSLFFAYDQAVENALVVGASEGVTAADVAYARALPPDIRLYNFAGALIYDGPFRLKDVHFADFEGRFEVPAAPLFNIGGANRSVNRVDHVTFAGATATRMQLWGERTWSDAPWTSAVRDDGSITGAAGLLVPDHPLNASAGDCAPVSPAAVDRGLRCGYAWGVLTFAESQFDPPYDAIHVPIKFERIERATGAIASSDPLGATQLTNKTGMIEGLRYRYRLSLSQPDAAPRLIRWVWQPEDGQVSPIIEIDGVAAAGCRPASVPVAAQLPSLAALDGLTGTGFRWEQGNLYMRLAAGADQLSCP